MSVNRDKYRELVLYICANCGDTANLGATKLNKVLWFSDVFAFMNWGQPITGEQYVKQQFGPLATNVRDIVHDLEASGDLEVRKVDFHGYVKTEYVPHREPDLTLFNTREISLVDSMIGQICPVFTAKAISDFSHNDLWEMAETNEVIPYYAMFAVHPGEIDEDDIAWAEATIERRAA